MYLSDVIGQARTKAFLLQLVHSGRIPHALLFLGPSGSGSLALAAAFAQMVQCENLTAEDACGHCNACKKAAQHVHPDIHFSYPTIGTNAVSTDFLKQWRTVLQESPYFDVNAWLQRIGAENKQGNINKDECNAIIKKLSLKTFEGRYKILLMWLPEYLGKEGNRLLKLIEEPPDNTLFLLVAENADQILNTILSRCQLVKIDPLADEEVAGALEQRQNVDPVRAQQIAFLAGGDYGQARYMADHPASDDAHLLLDWLRKCYRGFGPDLVQWTENFARLGRENQKQFLQYGLHFMRELMVYGLTGNPSLRLRPEEQTTAQNMSKVLNFDKIVRVSTLFNDNVYYIERNANPKILFLDTSIQLHQIMKSA
ncbi:MAG: hypothetical protein KGS48_07535 [Bacteroidetes bacterium]|nr:hypothetical protein [Bacteroidota bacterium]